MELQLNGKRALVTDGNTGIAHSISIDLAEAGADVAVNYLVDPDAAGATVFVDGGMTLYPGFQHGGLGNKKRGRIP